MEATVNSELLITFEENFHLSDGILEPEGNFDLDLWECFDGVDASLIHSSQSTFIWNQILAMPHQCLYHSINHIICKMHTPLSLLTPPLKEYRRQLKESLEFYKKTLMYELLYIYIYILSVIPSLIKRYSTVLILRQRVIFAGDFV